MATIATGQREFTIGTDATIVSEEKNNGYSERIRLIITNTSTGGQTFRIAVGNEPASSLGIPLYVGGSITWERDAYLPIQQKRVSAVASAAGGTLAVYEEVINRG